MITSKCQFLHIKDNENVVGKNRKVARIFCVYNIIQITNYRGNKFKRRRNFFEKFSIRASAPESAVATQQSVLHKDNDMMKL
jgi:hypothetical protein